MRSIHRYAELLFALILFLCVAEGLEDPITAGSSYLMSSSFGGDGYYLGCGDDHLCSILGIDGAQEHDGWTVHTSDAGYGFRIRDDTWALDVQSDGVKIFADETIASNLGGETWTLFPWPDGTYRLYNANWNANLDVKDSVTPFMNPDGIDNTNLLGQRWYFRSVLPETTITQATTTTVIASASFTSTTYTTTTTCPSENKRDLPTLKKRGNDLLSTSTSTVLITSTVTITSSGATSVVIDTKTVISCEPTSSTSATDGPSPTPGTPIAGGGAAATTPASSPTTPGGSGGTSASVTPSVTPSGAAHSFQVAMMGWISLFWLLTVIYI